MQAKHKIFCRLGFVSIRQTSGLRVELACLTPEQISHVRTKWPSFSRVFDIMLGDADKNLDWLCREAQALTILNGTERAEGNLYTFLVVPANV